MIEKIKKITDGKLDVSDEQISQLLHSVFHIIATKKANDMLELEQFGYTWTFWYEVNQDNVRMVELKISDYKRMCAWYIDMRDYM